MRITGGRARGRPLRAPRGGAVRPSQDRLRESLFSMLAPLLPDARVLDLYAGSGALGLEAWSRGAAEVWWVENEPRAGRLLRANVAAVCGPAAPGVHCVTGDARRPGRWAGAGPFTLVLADPPYAASRGGALVAALLRELAARAMLAPGGCVAIEQAAGEPAAAAAGWRVLRDRVVGDSRVVLYGQEAGAGEDA